MATTTAERIVGVSACWCVGRLGTHAQKPKGDEYSTLCDFFQATIGGGGGVQYVVQYFQATIGGGGGGGVQYVVRYFQATIGGGDGGGSGGVGVGLTSTCMI